MDEHCTLKIISILPGDPGYPSLPYYSAPALIFVSWFPPKKTGKSQKWRERGEQLRMLGLGYLLNNLKSLPLTSYLALIFATQH